MERMLIKHLRGSKANQIEEFALKHHNELIFGREEGSTVKYDPDRDDLVGRQHAKITRDPSDADGFLLSDLNSRNGTFLNKQRISGTMKLYPGDSVQFGPDGPEFQFEVEPRPANGTRATRIAEISAMGKSAPETRQIITNANSGGMSNSIPTAPAAGMSKPPGTVGKATVERMISHTVSETKKSQGRKFGVIGGAAALAVLLLFGVVVGGAYFYNSRQQAAREQKEREMKDQLASQQQESANKQADLEKKMADDKAAAGISSSEITSKYGDAVVYIEHSWHLYDAQTKSQLYHRYIPNRMVAYAELCGCKVPKVEKINPEAGDFIPVYLAVAGSDNKPAYEPLLTTSKETDGRENPAIGSRLRGTGFFVTSNGFILTNRHVGETWKTWYHFDSQTPAGIILNSDGTLASNSLVSPPETWVPSETKQSGKQYPGTITGTTESMTVTLNGKENRVNAKLAQSSDRHDVSLLKIDVAGEETKVELNDTYDTLKKGEQVTIMGYPAASPEVVGVSTSKDPFHSDASVLTIPQLTVTATNISNILRGSEKDADNRTYSIMGDVIQLATNATGPGNSGGPVFDSQGKVIGIFFAGSSGGGAAITYAVPIRFGMELIK